jgi:hypothetical protein
MAQAIPSSAGSLTFERFVDYSGEDSGDDARDGQGGRHAPRPGSQLFCRVGYLANGHRPRG